MVLCLSLELSWGAVGGALKAEARLGPQLCPSLTGPPWTRQFPFCLPFFHLYYEGPAKQSPGPLISANWGDLFFICCLQPV